MIDTCPECRHILPSGRKCSQPALHGKPFCIHHCRSRNLVQANRARNHSIALPPLEDRAAIQMSLDVVLAALAAGKINRRTAATYAYAIKIGSDNLARMEQAPPPEPVEICRDDHGDILAAEPTAIPIPGKESPCRIHATASSSHGWETATPQSTPVIPSDQSAAQEAEKPCVAATEHGWENEAPDPQNTPLEDLRNTSASHECDPEPPIPLTMTELRKSRLQIEQQLKQQRDALHYWSTAAAAKHEGEDPQLVINYIQQKIQKLEAELKEIGRLETPDPQEPDPPL